MAFKRIPGDSARRYVDTDTGEVVSRRQYENERYQAMGYESWSDFQGLRRDQTYMRWAQLYAEEHDISPEQARRASSGFNQSYLRARDDNWSKDADGSFADFLVDIGEREDDWEWDVGDTPGNGE